MSIRSFQDFHGLNEGKKLKDWQYTGTVSVGKNNLIYYQYPNNVKYYVSVTPEELEDYSEGGSLKKKLEKKWADSGKAMTRDEFEAKYLPKGPQGLGKYLSQGGRIWDHVESSEDDMYVEEARGWKSMEMPHLKFEVRKVMKAAKNRPAPFAVVAVKGGKVVAQDIDIKTRELIPAHYREMSKAYPGAKIHVEDAEGQSVMESVDMLPSYEVIAGLATVMGALDLAQAAKGGDSIIVDVAKALKAELGDKLEAAGAEAKRVVSKFKNDPKVKEIIMDAEEEVNESKRSTTMKIRLFEEYFNETKSNITPGSRVEVTGQSIGNMDKTLQGEVTRKNSNGTYEVSLDNGDMADYKADELKLIESVNEARPNFNQLAYISSAEYQKVKKLKNFNAADWKWDSKKDLYKNVRIEESINEARIIIKTKGKRLAIDKEDLERLKSGKDIVGYSTKYPGQEEWILARDKWEIEESVNEATETGLMVVPRTNADANKIKQWVDKSGMYGEWDAREGYFLFPEEEDGFDELEAELTKELDGLGVNYQIEGVFESMAQQSTKIKLFEEYFLNEREYSSAQREDMADSGEALPDGSYPIADREDLENAIKAYGRAKDQSAAAKHIAKRARALGLADLIPDTEDFQRSLKA